MHDMCSCHVGIFEKVARPEAASGPKGIRRGEPVCELRYRVAAVHTKCGQRSCAQAGAGCSVSIVSPRL